jgi:glycosyltransferase involved in cell wall biosynthesis
MKVSVMMITYNHEGFIARALQSILDQRANFEYEIVVGEDCSTDRTREILLDFCRRYPGRIVPLLPDQNLGMMRNLEQTLSACRGEYIALIEGDDYWTCSDKLQKQVDFLDQHPEYTISCHRTRVIDEGGTQRALIEFGVKGNGIHPSREAGAYTIEDLLSYNFIMTCSVVYRSSALGSLPNWFHSLGVGDWPLCALIAKNGPIYLMDEVLAAYRIHPGGVWSSQTSIARQRACIQMLKVMDEHLGPKYHDRIQLTIARHYIAMAKLTRDEGNRRETGRLLLELIRVGGWRVRECQTDVQELAAFLVLGSWQGMSISRKLVQAILNKFGYKVVRVDTAANRSQLRIRRM